MSPNFVLYFWTGWGGGGLGTSEQGIVEPIRAAEARDKMDMFKGIGIESDPFEQFRKNKSQGFIQRMRTRDENIEKSSKLRSSSFRKSALLFSSPATSAPISFV